jgi:hypothetical protein
MTDGQFYWCSKHQRVETGDKVCAARHRLGPYDTRAEAERALETVRERNEAWEAEDARWEGRRP